ncbi:MAG: type II and III secretion system protein family protein [Pseudomonadota bacterium]
MIRAVVCILAMCLPWSGQAAAWTVLKGDPDDPVLTLERSKSTVVETDVPFDMIVLSDPSIADTMVTTDRSFFVRGIAPGRTTILLYAEGGQLSEIIELQVTMGLDALRRDLDRLLPGEAIDIYPVHDGIFIDGRVTTIAAAELVMKIAETHVPGGVASGLTVRESQQVMLEVRFVEAGRDFVRDIGLDSQFANSDTAVRSGSGTVSGLAQSVATFIGVGGENLDVTLSALESKGVLRTLARPNLIALSGDKASFLAGGEVPVPVATGDGAVAVSYKDFGISLEFTPTVLGDGLINLHVMPEVSALDARNGVRSAGVSVPGFSVRRAETKVELHDGQAFAIAGLLQSDFQAETVNTPWLSNVPVLGALFSSRRYQRNETELVIIITPRLVQPASHVDALRTPLEAFGEPSEAEFFLLDRTTTPVEGAGS